MGWKSRMIPIPDSNADLLKQCDVHTFRASGKGGQHVNKTESAVRITHRESKTVVVCQDERSQHRNKEIALDRLRKKLAALKKRQKKEFLHGPPKAPRKGALRPKRTNQQKRTSEKSLLRRNKRLRQCLGLTSPLRNNLISYQQWMRFTLNNSNS